MEKEYWIIDTNRWSKYSYSEKEAIELSSTLIDCSDCLDCSSCSTCSTCSTCSNCSNCSGCSYCSYCSGCSTCSNCSKCLTCLTCSNCSYCSYCSNCSYCSGCSYCSDFEKNPQRYTTSIIGSRNSQTTIYYNETKHQIICGCFSGNIDDFEKKVKETHKNNPEYLKQYLDEIEIFRYLLDRAKK